MEGTTDVIVAKRIFGNNFIGIEKLEAFCKLKGIPFGEIVEYPKIKMPVHMLKRYAQDYLLVYGISQIGDFTFDLKNLIDIFGVDPELSEPCFYNQDWYISEKFMDETLNNKWYLLRINPIEETRAKNPELITEDLQRSGMDFPRVILCAYAFFIEYLTLNRILWKYDFVWCSDIDHNGDRIYAGKYKDIDKINKNGFSIHRHLRLRNCYTSICYAEI